MTDPAATLQFDTAEPVGATSSDVRCARCGAPLGTYFELNGAVACRACRDAAVAAAGASHVPTLIMATGLGLLAAALGSALYYAVAKITGYEIGLISIAVGVLVGVAVRKGSRARGGWRYQALAVFLTYLSIASTYVPRVIEAMASQRPPPAAADASSAPAATPSPDTAASPAPAAAETGAAADDQPGLLLSLGMLLAFTLALPFLAGFDNVMGLLIIAIGLWEAWKVNRIPQLQVSGPYAVGAGQVVDG